MKHSRRKTQARNILAKLRPAKLNDNPGPIFRTNYHKNRSAIRKGIRVTHRNCVPQKVMDYYGIENWVETDKWEIDPRWGEYFENIGGDSWNEMKKVDFGPEMRKKDRHRRLVRRDSKLDRLERRCL